MILAAALCTEPTSSQAWTPSIGVGEPPPLRLTFLGDIMGHDVNFRMQDFRDIYRGVDDVLKGDDLTFANLEFPVDRTRAVSGYPFFNANPRYVRAAIEEGVDVFSVANNHSFDMKEEGVFQTLRSLAALVQSAGRPILFSGIRGNPKRQFLPVSTVIRGLRVGFLAVTQFVNVPGAGRYVNVVDYTDRAAAEEFLSFIRDASPLYDLFIVSYHGGNEYVQAPENEKRAFFLRLVENGAHIVHGHHPHVVQGFETVSVGNSRRLILYSMGNFISGMTWRLDPSNPRDSSAPMGEAYMLSVEAQRIGTEVSVTIADPVPIANYRNERGEMVVGRLSELAHGSGNESAGYRGSAVSPAWASFFADRLRAMESSLSRH